MYINFFKKSSNCRSPGHIKILSRK